MEQELDIYGPYDRSRAWLEIDLSAIAGNYRSIRAVTGETGFMAVVKADAYGHGMLEVSRRLEREGVCLFAVATASEGIALRQGGVSGDILVMGYTPPETAPAAYDANLILCVADAVHARALSALGLRLRVHVKLDTGMNRLGERWENYESLRGIYSLPGLNVEGTFTHLCVSDSRAEDDIAFSRLQIKRFFDVTDRLAADGVKPGLLHYQSSCGAFNYPDGRCAFARFGVALYGVFSDTASIPDNLPPLRPAMSFYARVASVKHIDEGDTVSYGRCFTASSGRNIAIVTAGYADGIPRNFWENSRAAVLIRGSRAPVVGRICMDRFAVDVTGTEGVEPGDPVQIFGCGYEGSISCEEFAENCGTISNEILSRIGARPPRVYIG